MAAWQREGQVWAVALLGGIAGDSLRLDEESRTLLSLAAQSQSRRLKLVFWTGPEQAWHQFEAAIQAAARRRTCSLSCSPDHSNGRPKSSLAASAAPSRNAYVVDTLTLPFDNPYGALMFVSGLDFFVQWRRGCFDRARRRVAGPWHRRRSRAARVEPVCHRTVSALGREDRRRSGLCRRTRPDYAARTTPMATTRPTSTKTSITTAKSPHNTHEFATCLETDAQGNFYYLRCDSGGATAARMAACCGSAATDRSSTSSPRAFAMPTDWQSAARGE